MSGQSGTAPAPGMVLITCQRCGKLEMRHPQTKYCADCVAALNRERTKASRKRRSAAGTRSISKPRPSRAKPKKPASLAEINRAARDAGMTYGQYMEHMKGVHNGSTTSPTDRAGHAES